MNEQMDEQTQTKTDSDPLKALFSFHRRIRLSIGRLRDLARLPPALVDKHDAAALVEFFRGPLLWHDIDEEAVLLPALRARAGEPVVEGLLVSCSRAHESLEGIIDAILPHLDAVADGTLPSNPVLLRTAAEELDRVLVPHLAMEEREVFPLARRLLSENELSSMAAELSARQNARQSRRKP
jgi:hemerythrin-like domain-containing protein